MTITTGSKRPRRRRSNIPVETLASSQPGPIEILMGKESTQILNEALDALPPEERTICELTVVVGLSVKEAAARVGLSERTGYRRRSKGLAQLGRLLRTRKEDLGIEE